MLLNYSPPSVRGKEIPSEFEKSRTPQKRAASHKGSKETAARTALPHSGWLMGMRRKTSKGQLPWRVRNGSRRPARERLDQFK